MMSTEINQEIESADVTERLVGITPTYLNNFVQRGTFGLRASVQAGELRNKRRVFSVEDVYGVALVWLLFEAGLRTDPIIRILKEIGGTKEPNANLAAKKLLESDVEYLRVIRDPRKPAKTLPDKPEQKVERIKKLSDPRQSHLSATELLIPVGNKFKDIKHRIEILF